MLKVLEIPVDNIYYYEKSYSRAGISVKDAVDDTLENLRDQDKKILTMHYIKGMDQKALLPSSIFQLVQ